MLLLRLLVALTIVHLTLCNSISIINGGVTKSNNDERKGKLIKFKGIYAASLRLPMVRSSKPRTASASTSSSSSSSRSSRQDSHRISIPMTTASTSINDEVMNKKRLLNRVTKKIADRVKVMQFKKPNINIKESINNLKAKDVFNQNKRKKILILMSDTGILSHFLLIYLYSPPCLSLFRGWTSRISTGYRSSITRTIWK